LSIDDADMNGSELSSMVEITVPRDATIYTHNTNRYVACTDQAGGIDPQRLQSKSNPWDGYRPTGRKAKPLQYDFCNSGPLVTQLSADDTDH
jgi:hypothetical protein